MAETFRVAAVGAHMLVVGPIRLPVREFEFSYAHGSGPVGQNVNIVNSKELLTWDCTSSSSLTPSVRQRFFERYASRLRSDGVFLLSSYRFRDQKRNVVCRAFKACFGIMPPDQPRQHRALPSL